MIKWHDKILCNKGFLINLQSRNDRRITAYQALEKAGIEGVEIYNADSIPEEDWKAYGCTSSHLNILKYQADNNIDYILVVEDDIDLVYSYSNDYQIKDINNQKKYSSNLIDSFNSLKPDLLWLGCRVEEPVDHHDNYISYCNKTLTSHAYLSSLALAKFCSEQLKYNQNNHFSYRYPIDFFLSQIKVKNCGQLLSSSNNEEFLKNNLVTAISNCLIFNQKPDYSNILDRYTDYSIWILGCHEEYCFKPIKDKINYYEYV